MSALQQASRRVGYKPMVRKQKTCRNIFDEVLAPLISKPRNVHVEKAGGFVRVRFEGRKTNCFGSTIEEAKTRLQILERE